MNNNKDKKAKERYENLKKNIGEENTHILLQSLLGIMSKSGFIEAEVMQVSCEINDLINERIVEEHILNNKQNYEGNNEETDEKLNRILTFLKNIKSQIIDYTDTL